MAVDAASVLAALATRPDWFLHQVDVAGERALLVRLAPDEVRAAAFLDERVLGGARDGFWAPLARVQEALADAAVAPPPHAIFHIGHCGSTLVSRLLDRWPGVLGLREPLPLRTLAGLREELGSPTARCDAAQWDALFGTLVAALSRRPPGVARLVVKATSSANALIDPWLARPGANALLLHVKLAPYLATILKSASARSDALTFAPARLAALHALLGDDALRLPALSAAERIALGWVAELARFAHAAATHGARVQRLDFDAFLAAPDASLAALATHFGLPADAASVAHALDRAVLGSYAKATEHAYDAAARAADLAESRRRFGTEVDEGLRFAERTIARYPVLAPLADGL
ncbi:MAG TPA: hypothetical protein VFL14_13065 [Xanthomonadales bacterium]|nr:hypothetical protein [Xanthomonadales bacterium]